MMIDSYAIHRRMGRDILTWRRNGKEYRVAAYGVRERRTRFDVEMLERADFPERWRVPYF